MKRFSLTSSFFKINLLIQDRLGLKNRYIKKQHRNKDNKRHKKNFQKYLAQEYRFDFQHKQKKRKEEKRKKSVNKINIRYQT